jgi:LPS export ABC transporter protein LptC
MNKSGIILVVVAIVIALLLTALNTFWLSYSELITERKIKKIDYYLSDFTLLSTQPEGKMRYQVKALHLIHQQSTGSSEIFKPILKAQDSDNALLTIKAQKALQKTQDGNIELMGEVTIIKKSSKKSGGFQLATENLTYNPHIKTLQTKAAVTLESNSGFIQGIGLMSNLDQQEIRILSHVHAEFLPAGNK